jgi:hypothetical protein
MGYTCGLTGKSRLIASASLQLKGWDGTTFTFWSDAATREAPDVSQPACEPPPPPCDAMGPGGCDPDDGGGGGGGGGGGDYEEECYRCQQWFWYEDGQITDEWWECTEIDPSYCRAS